MMSLASSGLTGLCVRMPTHPGEGNRHGCTAMRQRLDETAFVDGESQQQSARPLASIREIAANPVRQELIFQFGPGRVCQSGRRSEAITRVRKRAVMLAGWSYRALSAKLEESAAPPDEMVPDAVMRTLKWPVCTTWTSWPEKPRSRDCCPAIEPDSQSPAFQIPIIKFLTPNRHVLYSQSSRIWSAHV